MYLRSLSIFCLSSSVAVFSVSFAAATTIEYNRDIRPILSDNCFSCHGPDVASRKADLRLDNRQAALDQNAFVPSKSAESELISRIFSNDPEKVMPTPESHKKLTDEQKNLLKQWIDQGAEYQSHWAFEPPKKHDFPEVSNTSWVRNPLDRFVLSKLESAGLEPAAEADIRTLIRRVSLDLTGLPPTAEEVEAVVADPAPDRYERYVDELLNRDAWGEHRGRYWLDYARYADSHGIHFDNYREMYSYRDWVIQAFNSNMPFDQFTMEQLAGDLLPEATLEQQIASGFNRCNITTNEGGAIDEEYQVLYTRDRVETTSAVWLGLTTGCAVCHDHKFDPISQREFYELSAFFNNTSQRAMDGNRKDTPPIVNVPRPEDRTRYFELRTLAGAATKAVDDHRQTAKGDFEKWISGIDANVEMIVKPLKALPNPIFHLPLQANDPQTISYVDSGNWIRQPLTKQANYQSGVLSDQAWTILNDNRPTFTDAANLRRDQAFTISAWVKLGSKGQTGAILAKMDEKAEHRGWDLWLESGKVGMHLSHKWPTNGLKVVSEKALAVDKWQHVAITYDGSSKSEGIKIHVDGVEEKTSIKNNSLTETIETATPLRLGSRSSGSPAEKVAVQDIRIYDAAISRESLEILRTIPRMVHLASQPSASRGEPGTQELFAWYLKSFDGKYQTLAQNLAVLESEKKEIESLGTIAHVMAEKPEPAKAFVLFRGDYDKRREEVTPKTPAVLPAMQEELPKNRLGLAKWLVHPSNPLVSRVTVNRFWQEMFGAGLVGSAGDFGVTGETPTHPQLLDHLAIYFVEHHWDVKDFFRMIVTSATYRQSAVTTDRKQTDDPANKLYSRGPRFRMDAEMVRDYGLAVSGLLSRKIGGPSVRPYQPVGVWEAVAMPGSDTRNYKEDEGEGLYRRSMYTFWKRAAPPASMEIFNAPSREQCTVRRERTNTPLQALVTLNDPQLVEAARVLAQRVLVKSEKEQDDAQKIQFLGSFVLGRCWTGEEQAVLVNALVDLRAYYTSNTTNADALLGVGKSVRDTSIPNAEHAAWTMLCNQVLNLDEVLCK